MEGRRVTRSAYNTCIYIYIYDNRYTIIYIYIYCPVPTACCHRLGREDAQWQRAGLAPPNAPERCILRQRGQSLHRSPIGNKQYTPIYTYDIYIPVCIPYTYIQIIMWDYGLLMCCFSAKNHKLPGRGSDSKISTCLTPLFQPVCLTCSVQLIFTTSKGDLRISHPSPRPSLNRLKRPESAQKAHRREAIHTIYIYIYMYTERERY